MCLDGIADDQWIEGDNTQNKLIRVLRFDPVRLQRASRKVSQVVCDNHLSLRFEGRGQDVAIIRVRQRQAVNPSFVADDKTISHGGIHQLPRSLQLRCGKVRAIFQNISDPFIVDCVCPSRPEKSGARQTDK